MGASGSTTRVVSIEAEDGGTVVTISEAVAKRLLGKETDVPKASSQPETHLPATSKLSQDEIQIVETYYQKRLKALEVQNEILRETSEESFASAVKEVEEKFLKPLPSCSVCTEFQDSVSDCYKNNKNTTINCSKEVKAFKECVQKHRDAALGKRGIVTET